MPRCGSDLCLDRGVDSYTSMSINLTPFLHQRTRKPELPVEDVVRLVFFCLLETHSDGTSARSTAQVTRCSRGLGGENLSNSEHVGAAKFDCEVLVTGRAQGSVENTADGP